MPALILILLIRDIFAPPSVVAHRVRFLQIVARPEPITVFFSLVPYISGEAGGKIFVAAVLAATGLGIA